MVEEGHTHCVAVVSSVLSLSRDASPDTSLLQRQGFMIWLFPPRWHRNAHEQPGERALLEPDLSPLSLSAYSQVSCKISDLQQWRRLQWAQLGLMMPSQKLLCVELPDLKKRVILRPFPSLHLFCLLTGSITPQRMGWFHRDYFWSTKHSNRSLTDKHNHDSNHDNELISC